MKAWPAALDSPIVGLLGAALSLAGASRPSFWYDEAATISASYSRSLAQLWAMLGNVDAVHGLYYLFMHGWFEVFPPTEFWSRRCGGAGQAALEPHRRSKRRFHLCGIAPSDVGGH
jgi:mannosyltransferase